MRDGDSYAVQSEDALARAAKRTRDDFRATDIAEAQAWATLALAASTREAALLDYQLRTSQPQGYPIRTGYPGR
jgi:hypothetical protein